MTKSSVQTPKPIKSVTQLTKLLGMDRDVLYAIVNSPQEYYKPYDIFKKFDAKHQINHWRHIDNPQGPLKHVQQLITEKVLAKTVDSLPEHLVGGLPGRSLKENASPHLGKNVVVSMDLEKCFEHVTKDTVYHGLIELGFGRSVAAIITKSCTFQNRLPQGSPASTILCNIALRKMSDELASEAHELGCKFSMYIDDITLSGNRNDVYAMIPRVYAIAKKYNMVVNKDKTEIFSHNRQQEVTGILTNAQMAIAKYKIERIRRKIISRGKKPVIEKRELLSLYGQIYWVQFVNRKQGEALHKLASMCLVDKITVEGPKPRKRTKHCSGYDTAHDIPVKPIGATNE